MRSLTSLKFGPTGSFLETTLKPRWRSLPDHGTERNQSSFVDTLDQETISSTFDVFQLFSTPPHNLRAALGVQDNQVTEEGQRFTETVSLNRGIQVRIFKSEDEALRWLMG